MSVAPQSASRVSLAVEVTRYSQNGRRVPRALAPEEIWAAIAAKHGFTSDGLRRRIKHKIFAIPRAEAIIALFKMGWTAPVVSYVAQRQSPDIIGIVVKRASALELADIVAVLGKSCPAKIRAAAIKAVPVDVVHHVKADAADAGRGQNPPVE